MYVLYKKQKQNTHISVVSLKLKVHCLLIVPAEIVYTVCPSQYQAGGVLHSR